MPAMSSSGGGSTAVASTGPMVRVTRGKQTTDVPVAGGARALVSRQSAAMAEGGRTVPVAGSLLVN